jgi:outer membrane lipoprotein carrier protein
MKMLKCIAALLLCCTTLIGHAESSAMTKLDQLLSRWKTLSADFTQRSIDSKGDVLETYRGHIYLNKPNRLRWIISEPEKQLVVADGKNIWIFDEELEQVTVQPLTTQLSETPALFLSGEFKSIEEGFNVQALNESKFRVTPKKEDTLLEYIILTFDNDDRLTGMQLKDVFGQTTDLTFTKIQINPSLDPSLFVFTPAKGVDVVGEAQ